VQRHFQLKAYFQYQNNNNSNPQIRKSDITLYPPDEQFSPDDSITMSIKEFLPSSPSFSHPEKTISNKIKLKNKFFILIMFKFFNCLIV
jgi:hypothetical protein